LDVDSHFQEPVTWLEDVDLGLARRCPGEALLIGTAHFVGADPGNVPKTPFWDTLRRWARNATLADAADLVDQDGTSQYFTSGAFDAASRVAWLDQVKIDHQVCNPTVAAHMVLGMAVAEPTLVPPVVAAYNAWASAAVRNHPRLHATAMVDLSRLSSARRGLARMAEHGSLTFLVPIDEQQWGRLTDDDAGRFWSEVAGLRLSPVMHLGIGVPAREQLAGSSARWADSQLRTQRCLLQWISSEWASKHPLVTVLVEELGVDWAIPWLRNVERAETTAVLSTLGDNVDRGRSLIHIARSQVAWVPLPRDPIEEILASREPPMLVFGSDYPHGEGWGADPLAATCSRGWDVGTSASHAGTCANPHGNDLPGNEV